MEIGINNEIKNSKETVEKAKKELNSDVFGFGQYLYPLIINIGKT